MQSGASAAGGGNGIGAMTGHQRPLAVVLAGGAGTRIGGRKAFVDLAGRPLIAHVIARLEPQVEGLAVNAAPDPGFDPFGVPVLPDAEAGQGPLGGILAAMRWAESRGAEFVLTAAVDTPFLPDDLAAGLAAAEVPASYARTPGAAHATTGLWSVDFAGSLEAALRAGTRKVRNWTDAVGAVAVPFGDEEAFLNVNTPEDLVRAERRLGG